MSTVQSRRPPLRFRFTIARLMIAVAVAAAGLAIGRTVGVPAFILLSIPVLWLGILSWRLGQDNRRLAGRALGISATAANIACAWCSVRIVGFTGLLVQFLGGLLILPVVLGYGAAWVVAATGSDAAPRRSRLLAWSLVLAPVTLPVSMMATAWPLQIAFLAARPAFDRLADRIAAGEQLARPEWAGVFRVTRADFNVSSGEVRLMIDADPLGNTGFLRLATPVPSLGVRPNVVVTFRLSRDDRWWYVEED